MGELAQQQPAHIDRDEQTKATTAITRAHEVVLKTEEDMGWASDDLATLRTMRKAFAAKLKALCKPFMDGIDALKKEFDLVLVPLQDAEKVVDMKITLCRNMLRVEADKLKREQEAAQREAERKARLANQPPPPPPAPVQEVARGFKVPTTGAKTGVMRVPKWRVVNLAKVPMSLDIDGVRSEDLFVLNEAYIGKLRRSFGDRPSPIPGIEFYYDETNTVR